MNDSIEKLCERATPGPWVPYFTIHGDSFVLAQRANRDGAIFPQDILATVAIGANDYGRADAEFIAMSREQVPALLARAEKAERERDALHAWASSMPDAGFRNDGSGRWEWWHRRPRHDLGEPSDES